MATLRHVAMVANFWISTNRGPANVAEKKTKPCLTFLCMTVLWNKTVVDAFLPSFDNKNGRLCQERLLRSRNHATMVTRRHTSLYC